MHAKQQFTPPDLSPNHQTTLWQNRTSKHFQLHTTRCSSAQMHHKLPRDFQTSVISAWLTNSNMANGNLIWSDSGGQEGDPLVPLHFSLAIHDIAFSMKSNFNVWYLNDAAIAGDPRYVCDDIKICSCMFSDISIFLNPSKSELDMMKRYFSAKPVHEFYPGQCQLC